MNLSPKAALLNLGCRVNQYETDCIREHLCEKGFEIVPFSASCDVCIINTCTVTAESDRKSRQAIRRAAHLHPDALIIAVGCSAQTQAKELSKIEGLDCIFGSRNKLDAVAAAVDFVQNRIRHSGTICTPPLENAPFEAMSISRAERTRAYIKIEDGCENLCSYCAIPHARGKVCSKSEADILKEVRQLAGNGYREIVLAGIETASWGKDLQKGSLTELIAKVAEIPGIERIRLGSLYPSFVDASFADAVSEIPKFMPHLHLSLQSGCDPILKAMNRHYTAAEVLCNMEYLRKKLPLMEFSCDLMVGFPGESDADHKATLDFLNEARFFHIHQFIYSPRPGTPAAERLDQIAADRKSMRAKEIRQLSERIRLEIITHYIRESIPLSVLFERDKNGISSGHTDNFLEIHVKTDEALHGQIHPVCITSVDADGFITAKRISK